MGARLGAVESEPDGPVPAYRRMFVTSTHGDGDLGGWVENTAPPSGFTGLAAGDHICQVRAEAAGLATAGTPVFRAWLSDATTDAWCHVQGLTGKKGVGACDGGTQIGGGPWVRTDDLLFSGPLAELVLAGAVHPGDRDETGAPLDATVVRSWTGTTTTGVATGQDCSGWTDGTGGSSGAIGRTDNAGEWTNSGIVGCQLARKLFCFEQGTGSTPPRPAVAGALAFVTLESGPGDLADPAWQPGSGGASGLAGADAVCQAAAAAAILPFPTSYVAWLSTSTVHARDRVAGDGPWKTLDGWPIAGSKADLTDTTIATPIRLAPSGASLAASYYWTGSSSVGTYDGSLASTCDDWTSASGVTGTVGAAGAYDLLWTTDTGGSCTFALRLLCLSDVVLLGWDNFETGQLARWTAVVGAP